ncbi:MAG: hypothetical protein JWQ11_3884, partial [Rhizobacter sp.]|nr:hypothetical protein [Rhizobacter sp.]
MNDFHSPSRRRLLAATLAGAALGTRMSLSFAGNGAPQGQRFVMVILRGGMDGLSAVPALGDPAFAEARGALGDFGGTPLPLVQGFALHPRLVALHEMYGRGEVAVMHATGLVYRERSHFDAQQVLESGGTQPHVLNTGWLGRALASSGNKGIALSTAVPLTLRGTDRIDTWAPSVLPEPTQELVARLSRMYGDDPMLSAALSRAQMLRAEGGMMNVGMTTSGGADMAGGSMAGGKAVSNATTMAAANPAVKRPAAPNPNSFAALARRAGEFLSQADGPQAAVLDINGWDTHAGQAAANGSLARSLASLDEGLAALRESLGGSAPDSAWTRTVVVVATEFGREVAINGTLGTDHGSGGAAFVLGGPVKGGRVVADWPGLAPKQRFEGRDLRTTTDLRAVLKGVLG